MVIQTTDKLKVVVGKSIDKLNSEGIQNGRLLFIKNKLFYDNNDERTQILGEGVHYLTVSSDDLPLTPYSDIESGTAVYGELPSGTVDSMKNAYANGQLCAVKYFIDGSDDNTALIAPMMYNDYNKPESEDFLNMGAYFVCHWHLKGQKDGYYFFHLLTTDGNDKIVAWYEPKETLSITTEEKQVKSSLFNDISVVNSFVSRNVPNTYKMGGTYVEINFDLNSFIYKFDDEIELFGLGGHYDDDPALDGGGKYDNTSSHGQIRVMFDGTAKNIILKVGGSNKEQNVICAIPLPYTRSYTVKLVNDRLSLYAMSANGVSELVNELVFNEDSLTNIAEILTFDEFNLGCGYHDNVDDGLCISHLLINYLAYDKTTPVMVFANGGEFNGTLKASAPVSDNDVTNKEYVDGRIHRLLAMIQSIDTDVKISTQENNAIVKGDDGGLFVNDLTAEVVKLKQSNVHAFTEEDGFFITDENGYVMLKVAQDGVHAAVLNWDETSSISGGSADTINYVIADE